MRGNFTGLSDFSISSIDGVLNASRQVIAIVVSDNLRECIKVARHAICVLRLGEGFLTLCKTCSLRSRLPGDLAPFSATTELPNLLAHLPLVDSIVIVIIKGVEQLLWFAHGVKDERHYILV